MWMLFGTVSAISVEMLYFGFPIPARINASRNSGERMFGKDCAETEKCDAARCKRRIQQVVSNSQRCCCEVCWRLPALCDFTSYTYPQQHFDAATDADAVRMRYRSVRSWCTGYPLLGSPLQALPGSSNSCRLRWCGTSSYLTTPDPADAILEAIYSEACSSWLVTTRGLEGDQKTSRTAYRRLQLKNYYTSVWKATHAPIAAMLDATTQCSG